MRVIGGEFRSRRINSLPGLDTRPTPDKLRETLFNVLGPSIQGSVFIDAHAGTGAVGIEALSRGARHAIFIEKDRQAAGTIQSNLASLGIGGPRACDPRPGRFAARRFARRIIPPTLFFSIHLTRWSANTAPLLTRWSAIRRNW